VGYFRPLQLYQLPQNITLFLTQSQPYSFQQKQICDVEMNSGLQHQRLLNNLINMNWACYGERNGSTLAKLSSKN
jgi:hypothetical protein